jgi:tetratricopeptide (TPR) repeat protein
MIVGRLEQLEAERGAHPLIATYGAELLLWAGDYDQAAVWLQRAVELDDHTRWAYIGLAILHNVTGRPEAALKAIARQQELLQPLANSFVCTAEAHLQLGDLGRAVTDYEAAVEAHPTRVAAWLGLAAARQRRGQSTAAPLERVRHLTPVFFGQWQQEAAGGDELEHLEHGLRMLRGNRGSGLITWRTRDGALHGENAGR